MKTIRILILEDDLETVEAIVSKLKLLENRLESKSIDFALTVLSEYTQVERYINNDDLHKYDVILLDRDDKIGGSFHTLDFKKFDKDRIVSISSIPEYNDEAKRRGIIKIVWKDYKHLEDFAESVVQEVKKMLARKA